MLTGYSTPISNSKFRISVAIFTVLLVGLILPGCSKTDNAVEQTAPQVKVEENPKANLQSNAGSSQKVTTETGLQYEDTVIGTGKSPEPGQKVSVHYTGWLLDGTKFDSSVDRGQPFQFPIGQRQVIRGWDEGVMTMKVGGKRRLTIPSDLAYGDSGFGDVIPPGATLVFDVELLDVN